MSAGVVPLYWNLFRLVFYTASWAKWFSRFSEDEYGKKNQTSLFLLFELLNSFVLLFTIVVMKKRNNNHFEPIFILNTKRFYQKNYIDIRSPETYIHKKLKNESF